MMSVIFAILFWTICRYKQQYAIFSTTLSTKKVAYVKNFLLHMGIITFLWVDDEKNENR